VRRLVRDPARLYGRSWLEQVELTQGDVLQPASLAAAMRDVSVVYYLVPSLGGGGDFTERDLVAARNCATAAKSAAVKQIIFLGGLGDPKADLSPHLRSRHETGAALRAAVTAGCGYFRFGQFGTRISKQFEWNQLLSIFGRTGQKKPAKSANFLQFPSKSELAGFQ
jgi:putative NADH-flavin reductase